MDPRFGFLGVGASSIECLEAALPTGVISSSANLFGLILRPLLLTISVPGVLVSGVEGVAADAAATTGGGGVAGAVLEVVESLLLSVRGRLALGYNIITR